MTGLASEEAGWLTASLFSGRGVSPHKIYIIGIGDDGVAGLTASAQRLIDDAELIVGPPAMLAMVTNRQAQHVEIGATFDDAVRLIGEHPARQIVVLATGDPCGRKQGLGHRSSPTGDGQSCRGGLD